MAGRGARVLRGIVGLVAVLGVLACAGPAGATDAYPSTNDQGTTQNVAWAWYHGVTGAQVAAQLSALNARLTQIRVDDPSVPTFTVSMVANSGSYAVSGWWWYYGLTSDLVSNYV